MTNSTHNELLDRFGGNTEVARLIGVTPQAVSQWRTNGIPKAYLMLLQMRAEKRSSITKHEALKIMRLISAMESWMIAQGKMVPDYLLEDTESAIQILEREILGPDVEDAK